MDGRSSQHGKRSERLNRTPYARPTPTKPKTTPGSGTFGAIKSVFSNLISSPFSRGSPSLPTHNSLPVDRYQRSESGSEDNWEGDEPVQMKGQDVFSLAEAAGRGGEGFEARQVEWRTKGEVAGGRREAARRDLQVGLSVGPMLAYQNGQIITPTTPIFPGHFVKDAAPPSLPPSLATVSEKATGQLNGHAMPNAIAGPSTFTPQATSVKTPSTLPARLPLPASFTTPSHPSVNGESSSQYSNALATFLQERQGQELTAHDKTIIAMLTERITGAGAASPVGSERRRGWLPNSSSGDVAYRGLNQSTSSGLGGTPYKQKYLGPGMSPRKTQTSSPASSRVLSQSTSPAPAPALEPASLPPSFPNRHLINTALRYSATSSPLRHSHKASPTPAQSYPANTFSPASGTKRKPESPADKASAKRREVEETGRQNAAAIMLSLIEQTEKEAPQSHIEPVRWNSYDRGALNKSTSTTPGTPGPASVLAKSTGPPAVPNSVPSTAHAGSTPRKKTPLRGAAAKMEAFREGMVGSKGLTTIERIKGVKPWEAKGLQKPQEPSKQTKPVEEAIEISSDEDDDDIEIVEEAASKKQTSKPTAVAAPEAPKNMFESAPFTFSSPSLSLPAFPSTAAPAPAPKKTAEVYDSPLRKSIIEAPKKDAEQAKAFSFSTPASFNVGKPAQEEEPAFKPIHRSASPKKASAEQASLTPKEAALKMDKAALPFFTFVPPSVGGSGEVPKNTTEEKWEKAKGEAKGKDVQAFTFTLDVSAPSVPAATAAKPSFGGFTGFGQVSGQKKDEPKTTSAAPTAPSFGGFTGFGQVSGAKKDEPKSTGGGPWKCSMCMLENPDSAKEKCTICEEPRPKAAAPAPAVPAKPSFGGFTGFGQVSGTKKDEPTSTGGGPWKCSMCMLDNPDSAKEKCTICEEPRPKAAAAPAPTPASTGFGGFGGFGSKPAGPAAAGGSWTCGTCMLQNPDSATEKCTICEEPRPKSTSTPAPGPTPAPVAAPTIAATPFTGWGAGTGPKMSEGGEGKWTCSTCMLENPGSATEKCTICETPK
ncbi:hypothetical protein B9479_005121 [Cryptococcus floricola]|uniref:RanBP2-type domain-containing protein n=1 Tax=Cryptococcus floricola TaxID=2591691 RepID=A0A5D3ARZ0_9TREE|nr:hypothetical protein B9479_005121 [Cryptococcus floricola]